jgi:hypothetical protein
VAEAEDHENKGKIQTLVLLPVAVHIHHSQHGFGKHTSSGSLSNEDTHTLLQANADAFKA